MREEWSIRFQVQDSSDRNLELRLESPGLEGRGCPVWSENRGKRYEVEVGGAEEGPTRTIPEEEGKRLLQALRAARVGAVPDFAMGLDGTTYRLAFTCGFNAITYQWWGDLPAGWDDLAPLISELEKMLRREGSEVKDA